MSKAVTVETEKVVQRKREEMMQAEKVHISGIGPREGDLAARAYAVREWCESVRLDMAQTEASLSQA